MKRIPIKRTPVSYLFMKRTISCLLMKRTPVIKRTTMSYLLMKRMLHN